MQAPKVTLFNGQVGTVRCGERQFFVTGIEATVVNGTPVLIPKNTPVDLGDTITMCGRVSADQRVVNLRVHNTRTRLVGDKVEMVPVTTQVRPVFEGGAQGKPVPLTQFLQAPQFRTTAAEKVIALPTGRTVVVGWWVEPADPKSGRDDSIAGRFLKPTAPPADTEVVVVATVNIIRAGEAK